MEKVLFRTKHYQWDYSQWGGGKVESKWSQFMSKLKDKNEPPFTSETLPYVWFIGYWTMQHNLLDVQHVLVTYAQP